MAIRRLGPNDDFTSASEPEKTPGNFKVDLASDTSSNVPGALRMICAFLTDVMAVEYNVEHPELEAFYIPDYIGCEDYAPYIIKLANLPPIEVEEEEGNQMPDDAEFEESGLGDFFYDLNCAVDECLMDAEEKEDGTTLTGEILFSRDYKIYASNLGDLVIILRKLEEVLADHNREGGVLNPYLAYNEDSYPKVWDTVAADFNPGRNVTLTNPAVKTRAAKVLEKCPGVLFNMKAMGPYASTDAMLEDVLASRTVSFTHGSSSLAPLTRRFTLSELDTAVVSYERSQGLRTEKEGPSFFLQ